MRVFQKSLNVAGDRPPRYEKKRLSFTVGRGPVPRHAAIAGDRPPRYGKKGVSEIAQRRGGQAPALRYPEPPPPYRRAGACPSPCSDRGGNPLGCAYGIRGPSRYGKKQSRSGAGAPELQWRIRHRCIHIQQPSQHLRLSQNLTAFKMLEFKQARQLLIELRQT